MENEKKTSSSTPEQKTKLICFIIVCVLIIIVGSVYLISSMIKKSKADPENFKKNYEILSEQYDILSYNLSGNEFTVEISPERWRSLSSKGKEKYCQDVFGYTKQLLWKHHYFDEPDAPNMKFYTGTICAEILFDRLIVY